MKRLFLLIVLLLSGCAQQEIILGVAPRVLVESQGGTGTSTYITGDLLYASGTDQLGALNIGAAGQVLTVTAGLPAWAAAGGSGTDDWDLLASPNNTLIAPSTTRGIAIATSTARPSGLFNVDTFGNVSTSGTVSTSRQLYFTANATLDTGAFDDGGGLVGPYGIVRTSGFLNYTVPSSGACHSFYVNTGTRFRICNNTLTFFNSPTLSGDFALFMGSENDALIWHNESLQTPDTLQIGVGADSNTLQIIEAADRLFDFSRPQQTSPAIFLNSQNQTQNEGLWIISGSGTTSTASTTFRTYSTPINLQPSSSTVNVIGQANTTTLAVTSTALLSTSCNIWLLRGVPYRVHINSAGTGVVVEQGICN